MASRVGKADTTRQGRERCRINVLDRVGNETDKARQGGQEWAMEGQEKVKSVRQGKE